MIKNTLLSLISAVFCVLAVILLVSGDASDRWMAAGVLAFFAGCALIGASLLFGSLRKSKPLAQDSSGSVIFRYDPWFHLAFGLASWGMTAGAVVFALQTPFMWLVAIPALVLFGLGGGLLLLRAVKWRNPVIVIGEEGVIDRRIMSQFAPWKEIQAVGFPEVGPVQYLLLVADGAQRYRRPRNGLLGWVGRGTVTETEIMIAVQGLNGSITDALAAIGARKPDVNVLGDFTD